MLYYCVQIKRVGNMVLSLLSKITECVRYYYFHYTLISTIYMMEPKERFIFNSVIVLILTLILYASVIYLPGHLMMLFHFLLHISGITPYAVVAATENIPA